MSNSGMLWHRLKLWQGVQADTFKERGRALDFMECLQILSASTSSQREANGFVKVPVKRLDQVGVSTQHNMDKQFKAEVAAIGSVSHVNLVSLKGFCMEKNARFLVFEFMPRRACSRRESKKMASSKFGYGVMGLCVVMLPMILLASDIAGQTPVQAPASITDCDSVVLELSDCLGSPLLTPASAQTKRCCAVRQPYIRVVGIEQATESSSRGISSFTADEELEFKQFARRPITYQALCALIAPSIFGHEDVKKSKLPDGFASEVTKMSCFLVIRLLPNLSQICGEDCSHCCIYLWKGFFSCWFDSFCHPRCKHIDGGVVCIHEFDKMHSEDRVAIHEAMEQQTISIAKAGITTVLNSRTSVLAAANPPSGHYDDLKTAQENIDLEIAILSRFNLIFIVKDSRDCQRDMQIAKHIVSVHTSAGAVSKHGDTKEKDNLLKRYIEYSRHHCSARLPDTATTMLQNNYVRIQQQMRQQSHESDATATEEHVTEALRLFCVSTLDAAHSCLKDYITVTPEMRTEIQKIETQIKRRMDIGSYMSERRFVDELGKTWMGQSSVRRALVIMSQRDEIEYRRERRVILRKA
ncbi:hypothetical protein GOP47_0005288 [Adiantum capillus-veneris]|uniref:MCM C-terminal AAA(+) ATPase domain-containing protein n=1 Tax=Adiantum capillus-veneris TaxID=13818 RepID=A0A9D4ZLF6_ADICA|nr:hypothetical protein GOP47_0005288 [Adiantum capillus-veneris]